MALFLPFRGMRYHADSACLSRLVCPPYDIIDDAKRRALLQADGDNIVSVELPAGGDDRYDRASEQLARMIASRLLRADAKETFYVYRMVFSDDGDEKFVDGVVGRLRLELLDGGVVLPHENTLSKAKDDRLNLMKVTAANISSVYALFGDEGGAVRTIIAEAVAQEPLASVEMDGVTHSIYAVIGEDAEGITAALADKPLFIADGHHRYETGLNYKAYRESLGELVDDSHPANYIMTTCVPMEHPGLVVFPTHRIIQKRDGFDSGALIDAVAAEFDVERMADASAAKKALRQCYDANRTAFLYYDGGFSLLRLKDGADLSAYLSGRSDSYKALDVSVLHGAILEPRLGIGAEDMAGGKSLVYTRDFNEAVAAVDRGEASCAFIINPTRVAEIAAVARDGERMPQKSTYFYPKLITGLVINKM